MITTTTALQALADTQAQHKLVSSQLEAVAAALQEAPIGTEQHMALSSRAMQLKTQLKQLETQIDRLKEEAKTEVERQSEAAAKIAEESKALAAKLVEYRAKVETTIAAINQASDDLAALLATAATEIPELIELLQKESGYRLSGDWTAILPQAFGGNGRIAGIPYVLTTTNGARLTTRYEVRKHLG
jgi:alanyl-tRNA synthetase